MSTISRMFSLIGSFDFRGTENTFPQTRAHDALVLLASLAKADGVLGQSERLALATAADAHIGNRADALAFLDDPDQKGLDDVAARIRRTWSEDERTALIGKAAMVAAADGSVGEIEEAMLDRLARLLDVAVPQVPGDDGRVANGHLMPDTLRKPVLLILHQEHSTPGRVGRLLAERGHPLDIRRPRFGDPLPCTMADHAGAVIFGGPMSANDPDDFIKLETEWIGTALKESAPYLGICLGAQMLANQLGGRVYAHPEGRAEIGYYPLAMTQEGNEVEAAMKQPWPAQVYQWHREGFNCPNGATCLATGGDFPVQAIQTGPAAFGIQFHPEVTPAMMYRWTTRAHERLALPGAQPRHAHFEGWYQHDRAVATWLSAFLDHWLAAGAARAA